MKKIALSFILFFFLLGLTACSSELTDKQAVQLATNQYYEKALQEFREYEPQANRFSLNLTMVSSDVLSNDGINAIVKLVIKQGDNPKKGMFHEPFSGEIEVTKPE